MPNKVTFSLVLRDKFSGAAKKVSRNTETIRRKFAGLGPAAKRASVGVQGAFAGMKKAAIGFQASMAPLLAAFAGVAGILKGFSIGSNFESAMADLSAITGATGEDLRFLKGAALDMGQAANLGAAETAEAFKLVASAKPELLKNVKALAQVTEQVLLLSNASGVDLREASLVTAESLNQFGAGAKEAARFVNVLAAGSKLGASEVGETGRAIVNVGVVAKRAGLNFEETNAAIQVLAQAGIKGGRSGRQLKGVLLSLEGSVNKKLRPSLVGVNVALQNLQDLQLSNIQLEKLFGRENIAAGGALSDLAGEVKRMSEELTGTNIAQEQAAIRLGTTKAKMRGLAVTISNKVIKVFEKLSPQINEVANRLGSFFRNLDESDLDGFAGALGNIVGLMTQLASITAKVAPFFGPLFKLIGVSLSGLKDLGTLVTGGDLTAANSASFKNAVRLEKAELAVEITAGASPGSTIDSVKAKTTGKISGLKTGVNMAEAA